MVDGQKQNMLISRKLKERGAEQRATLKIERTPGFLCDPTARFCFPLLVGERAEVKQRKLNRSRLVDYLMGHTVMLAKCCPKRCMASDDLVQALLQGGNVQRAA